MLDRRVFLEIDSPQRTDDNFRIGVPKHFENCKSPFENTNISVVHDFPLDYMHLICLGVMKKLLTIWIIKCQKEKSVQFPLIDQMYCSLNTYVPSDFIRKPRTFIELCRWKATEFHLFLLYLSPIIIQTFLSQEERVLFNSLNCATRILCDQEQCVVNNKYAHDLMIFFVSTMRTVYGDHTIIYNVHNLIHLARYCLSHGPLDTFSVFIFEDYLQTMKQLIKTGNSPLSQVMNRIVERSKFYPLLAANNTESEFRLLHPKQHSRLPEGYSNAHTSIAFLNFSLSDKPPDNCCY